ncbi:MAG: hypothetical protein K6C99_01860 [Lachnospiraceae bacterium]|nr:hypothetical protein [Lachnospiraceae bacterium]
MDLKNVALVIGMIVGIVLSVLIIRMINKDGKFKTKYDEMQEIVRGRAYKYAFWTLVCFEALVITWDAMGIPAFLSGYAVQFLGIIIAVMVQVNYSIWNNAYIGLNTNPRRFAIISIIIGIFNLLVCTCNTHLYSAMVVNGRLNDSVINLVTAFCFVIIGVELFIKHNKDKAESESGEE